MGFIKKWECVLGGKMKKNSKTAVGTVDNKGRILVPVTMRERFNIGPKDKIEFEVKKVEHRLSFIKTCKGILKDKRDAVTILHEESPFR